MIEDDSNGWYDYEAARLRRRVKQSIIRRFSVFLLKHGLIKEKEVQFPYSTFRTVSQSQVLISKSIKIFGFDTGYFHSYDGPALIDKSNEDLGVEHSKEYYIYGLKYSKAEWDILVKKHKIELIKKG
jgi:hypothetical protein